MSQNDHLVLIEGKAACGKSGSLMNLVNPSRVAYLNCESGKKLPFPAKFNQVTVTDPLQVPASIDGLKGHPDYDVIVVDSLSFLMEMFESQFVVPKAGTKEGMTAWSDYAQFFKTLMQQSVANSDKAIIFTSHVADAYNESELVVETKAVIKGAVSKIGVEAFFSCVIAAKKVKIKDLKQFDVPENKLLTITPQDLRLGFKYVFQTQLTEETVNEKIRGPMGMWSFEETYINADTQLVLDRLNEYYGS